MHEVVDPVAARVPSGDEGGPRDRALRWHAAGEAPKSADPAKPAHMSQLALGHHTVDDLGVEAVQAQHDDLALPGWGR